MTKAERLGGRIRELRYRRGLTQAQLASRAGVGEKTLKRLEAGKTDTPHPETLAAVAGALGLRPEELFDALEAEAQEAVAWPAIHQLPRPPHNFTGRGAELDELQGHRDRGAAIIAIHGMGGIGKTALSLLVAERWTGDFPDGQFYLDLRGAAEPVAPVDAMLHVIRSLEPGRPTPKTEPEVEAAYRTVLRSRRTLLLMDNAAGREQVEALVPPDGSLLLLTSRQRFALPGMQSVALRPFDDSEAQRLIHTLAPHAQNVGARLAGLCGGLPLALSLAARALAERPDLDPDEYAARLVDDRDRLRQLDASEASGGVEASFELSFGALDDALRSALCTLSVFTQHFDRAAAASLWGLSEDATDARIGSLLRFHLLDWSGAGADARYRLHDLVRLFAGARLPAEQRAGARLSHARHFLGLLARADTALRSGRTVQGSEPGSGRPSELPPAEWLSVLDREWAHITAALAFCRELAPSSEAAAALAMQAAGAATVLRLRMHASERIEWFELALSLDRAQGRRALAGRLLAQLGHAHQELGDPRRAIECCQRALAIAAEEGARVDEASALVALGDAYHALGEPRQAIEFGERGLVLARETGDRIEEASALIVLGWGYRVMNDLPRAIECCEQALLIAREFRDRAREGLALLALGFASQASGQGARGRECGLECLRIARESGDRRLEGYSLIVAGDASGGDEPYLESIQIARETGDRRMEGNALLALGFSRTRLGDPARACEYFERSLAIAEDTGDRSMEGIALTGLGVNYTALGEHRRAVEALARDEEVSRAMGNRPQEALAAWLLGNAHELLGELEPAVAAMERADALRAERGLPGQVQVRARIAQLRKRLGQAHAP